MAEWISRRLGGLETLLQIPSGGGPHGLLLSLHGCSQTHRDIARHAGWACVAREYGLVVALPAVPDADIYEHLPNCWDYYDMGHGRDNRHTRYLLALVDECVNDPTLAIDPRRIYISGLSSGATQALVTGLLAPDVFAGIGACSAPTIGTGREQVCGGGVSLNQAWADAVELCGANLPACETQIAALCFGRRDALLHAEHHGINAEVLRRLYGTGAPATRHLSETVTETTYADEAGPRLSVLAFDDMKHQWPAGPEPQTNPFFRRTEVDFTHYLARFFERNNRRSQVKPAREERPAYAAR